MCKSFKERLRQLEIHASFRVRNGDYCAVCGRTDVTVHHIVPQRRGGTDEDSNLICLCRPHHKLADRITLNEFQRFTVLHEPDTKAGLVEFIQLIVQSGVQQKHQRQKQQKHQGQAVAA